MSAADSTRLTKMKTMFGLFDFAKTGHAIVWKALNTNMIGIIIRDSIFTFP